MENLNTYIKKAEDSKFADISKIEEFSKTHKIVDTESLLDATEFLAKGKKAIKMYNEDRLGLTRPIKETAKKIEAIFKKKTETIDRAITLLSSSVLQYNQKLQAEAQREAAKKAEEERQKKIKIAEEEAEAAKLSASIFGGGEVETEVIEKTQEAIDLAKKPVEIIAPLKLAPIRTTSGSSSIRKDWVFEVVNMSDLASSRSDLVIENSVAIRAAIRNGERDIPGLKIYQKETLSVR